MSFTADNRGDLGDSRPMLRLIPLFCACLLGCATAKSPVFDDLRALDKQQDYRELVTHLKEVPAAQRDAEWEELSAKAHAELLKTTEVKTAADGERALATIKDQLETFPTLKLSPTWLAARADLGAKAFGWTYANYRHASSDEQWVPQVLEFVKADTTTKGLPLRMAKDLVLGRLVASSAWPLYQLAFEREGDAVCADEKLPAVVLDIVGYHSWQAEMKTLVTQRCAAQLKSTVFEKAIKGEDRGFQVGVCKMLAGEVPPELTKACE